MRENTVDQEAKSYRGPDMTPCNKAWASVKRGIK